MQRDNPTGYGVGKKKGESNLVERLLRREKIPGGPGLVKKKEEDNKFGGYGGRRAALRGRRVCKNLTEKSK